MKGFLNRDYVENFVKFHKKTIIKVVAGFVLFAAAFFVFCIRDSGSENGTEFKLSDGEVLQQEINEQGASKSEEETSKEGGDDLTEDKPKNIYVDISGAVKNPYVYELKEGTRLYEAIEMAGGMTSEADVSNLNLAMILSDQDKITVFTKDNISEEIKKEIGGDNKRVAVTNPTKEPATDNGNSCSFININTANETELQTITGIGPSTAEKIISYRKEHGEFKKIEELMNVSGIGEKTFAKYKDKITV